MIHRKVCHCHNWKARNNSKNVAAVLNPGSSTETRDCYCFRENVPPQLFSRPKECPCEEICAKMDWLKCHEGFMPVSCARGGTDRSRKRDFFGTKERGYLRCFDGKGTTTVDICKYDSRRGFCGTTSSNSEERDDLKRSDDGNRTTTVDISRYGSRRAFYGTTTDGEEKDDLRKSDDGKGTTIIDLSKYDPRRTFYGTTTSENEGTSEFAEFNGENRRLDNQRTIHDDEDDPQRTSEFYGITTDIQGEENSIDNDPKRTNDFHSEEKTTNFSETTKNNLRRTNIYGENHPKKNMHFYNEDNLKSTNTNLNRTTKDGNPSRTNKELADFRNDHYFETHSTEDLLPSVPEHTCVHSFDLDDRLLPRALHADNYGTSRCIICGKPMEPPLVRQTDARDKKKNVFPKYYKYGLAPRKIFLGNGDIRMEVQLNCDDIYVKGSKKPHYFDTFALRYQKGVA